MMWNILSSIHYANHTLLTNEMASKILPNMAVTNAPTIRMIVSTRSVHMTVVNPPGRDRIMYVITHIRHHTYTSSHIYVITHIPHHTYTPSHIYVITHMHHHTLYTVIHQQTITRILHLHHRPC